MKEYGKATAAGVTQTVPVDEYLTPPVLVGDGVETIAVAATLDMTDSGKTFFLKGATAGANITLPAVATSAGFRGRFIVAAAFATTAWTITAATAVIQGGAIVNSTFVPAANESLITFAHAAETLGDFIDLECDGTNWYASGVATAAGGITFTAP